MDTKWWCGTLLMTLATVVLVGSAYYLGKTDANNKAAKEIQKLTEKTESRADLIVPTTKYPIKMPKYPMGCGEKYKVLVLNAPDPEKGHREIRFESFALGDGPFVILVDCTGSKHYVPWTSILRIEERK